MGIGESDLFVAADVHYLASGGARAAAVVSTDAAFSRVVTDRVELVPEVEPYRPGQFYLRELPPLRAVLECPAPPPPTSSGRWPASTGCPMSSIASTHSPATATGKRPLVQRPAGLGSET